jgi:hypothetical protein
MVGCARAPARAHSRYAMQTPDVCPKMPFAYVKEAQCNGELLPVFSNVCTHPCALSRALARALLHAHSP